MPKLPALKPREVEHILLKAGFIKHTTKSSHRTYKLLEKKHYTQVAFHPGTIPPGTLRAIIRQSGMTVEEFLSFHKKGK